MALDHSASIMEALSRYLAGLKAEDQRDGQQELNRFVQWCGRDRRADELTPPEIGEYAESAGIWGADSANRLKPVKSFLSYLKDRKLTSVSLAPHLRVSKSKRDTRRVYFTAVAERAQLSPEGFANLQSRLEMLKEERVKVTADIHLAMADKDFKENSPLDAAKERQGLIESTIRELEKILANAVVPDNRNAGRAGRVALGKSVTLKDVGSGKEVKYTLVDPREADPINGKISIASPVGKALLDKPRGEEVQITVPRGTVRYVIKEVGG